MKDDNNEMEKKELEGKEPAEKIPEEKELPVKAENRKTYVHGKEMGSISRHGGSLRTDRRQYYVWNQCRQKQDPGSK